MFRRHADFTELLNTVRLLYIAAAEAQYYTIFRRDTRVTQHLGVCGCLIHQSRHVSSALAHTTCLCVHYKMVK
jgi:hypothetical protein